jgi:hypothetical protein
MQSLRRLVELSRRIPAAASTAQWSAAVKDVVAHMETIDASTGDVHGLLRCVLATAGLIVVVRCVKQWALTLLECRSCRAAFGTSTFTKTRQSAWASSSWVRAW